MCMNNSTTAKTLTAFHGTAKQWLPGTYIRSLSKIQSLIFVLITSLKLEIIMDIVMLTKFPPLSLFQYSQHSVKALYDLNIDIVTLELGFFAFYHHYLGNKKKTKRLGLKKF